MSAPCTRNHRNDETRSRCHNPECRRRAAANGSSTARTDKPKPPPPSSGRRKTIPDANGDPLIFDPANPVIERATLSPESVAALPKGTRFTKVVFKPGDYTITDATLDACKMPQGSRVALMGNSVIQNSTARGSVFLGDETFSTHNTYHGDTIMGDAPASTDDYFAEGYSLTADSNATVDRANTTFGEGAQVVRLDPVTAEEAPEEAYPQKKKSGWGRKLLSGAGKNIGMSALWALDGGSRGAGRRRRRRR